MKGVAINVRAARVLNKLCAIAFHFWTLLAELPFRSFEARGACVTANDLQLARANLFQGEALLCYPLRIGQGVLKRRYQP